jgi:DNA polymerase-1
MTMRTDLDLRLDLAASPCPGVLPLDATTLHRALAGAELDSLQWLAHRTLVSWDAEPPWRTSGAGGRAPTTATTPTPAAAPVVPEPVAPEPVDDGVLTLF